MHKPCGDSLSIWHLVSPQYVFVNSGMTDRKGQMAMSTQPVGEHLCTAAVC